MSGILLNITAYAQYNGVFGRHLDARFTEEYTYQNYFTYGIVAMAITLVVVLAVALVALNRAKASHAWAAENSSAGRRARARTPPGTPGSPSSCPLCSSSP